MHTCKISSHFIKGHGHAAPLMLALLLLLSLNVQAQQAASSAREAAQPYHQSGDISGGEKEVQPGSRAEGDSAALNTPQRAQAESNGLIRFFKKTEIEAFLDTYYSYNFNHPASRVNLLRSFDIHERRFAFSALGVAFDKQSTADSRIGFRLDFIFGPAADYLNSAEPGNIKFYKNIHQAYISYLVPVGAGLQLDAGKFDSLAGAEVDEAKENWNYSRGLLYALAQPAFHTGLRAKYEFNERASLLAALVNGWSNIEENNRGKTFGLTLAFKPVTKLSLTQTYIVGPEQFGDDKHRRHLLDTIVSYEFNERLSVLSNYDYGLESLKEGGRARWQGVAAYLRYAFTKRLAFSPRFELYQDYDGYTSGTAQRLKETTLSGEYKFNKYLLTRLEYRKDWSNQFVFQRSNPDDFARTQATVLGGVILSLSTRDDGNGAGTDAPLNVTSGPAIPQPSGNGRQREGQKSPEKEDQKLAPAHSQVSEEKPGLRPVSLENITITDRLPQQ